MSAIAIEHGCCRIDLNVHNANTASGFYEALGMADTKHTPYRLHGPALTRLTGDRAHWAFTIVRRIVLT